MFSKPMSIHTYKKYKIKRVNRNKVRSDRGIPSLPIASEMVLTKRSSAEKVKATDKSKWTQAMIQSKKIRLVD